MAVDMPLYDSNMCPTCFFDLSAFKFCCDSGKAHRTIKCADCGVDLLMTGKALSKFCTVSGKPHPDPKSKEVSLEVLDDEESVCPFCDYSRSEHAWCTETGWPHAELSSKYRTYKQLAQKPAPRGTTIPPAIKAPLARGKVPAPTALKPESLKRPKIAPAAGTAPPPTTPKVPPPPAKSPQYTDGSFLMTSITPDMRILFVGEGNFSFSRTIGKRVFGDKPWTNMVATDLELLAGVNNPGHQLTTQNLIELMRMGASVSFGVDATKIQNSLPHVKHGIFDLMTFQFPHNSDKNFPFYPYPKGLPLESVGSHREMLSEFLKQAAVMLREGGRACITTKTSEPYKSWEVDMLCEPPMWFTRGDQFDQLKWAELGYSHINTVNKSVTNIDGALTYIFTKDSTGCVDEVQGTFHAPL